MAFEGPYFVILSIAGSFEITSQKAVLLFNLLINATVFTENSFTVLKYNSDILLGIMRQC